MGGRRAGCDHLESSEYSNSISSVNIVDDFSNSSRRGSDDTTVEKQPSVAAASLLHRDRERERGTPFRLFKRRESR